MTSRKVRTADYSQAARERLGAAVTSAREALGHKFRPTFAEAAGVSLRSLADIETGKPGIGESNLRAVGRALPNWTEDTPRVILEGGPIPPPASASQATGPDRPAEPPPPRHEWSAEARARMLAMSDDEMLEEANYLRHRYGSSTAKAFLVAVLRLREDAGLMPDGAPDTTTSP